MGREFVLAPSPLEVNSLPVSYVVPELPWKIDVVLEGWACVSASSGQPR